MCLVSVLGKGTSTQTYVVSPPLQQHQTLNTPLGATPCSSSYDTAFKHPAFLGPLPLQSQLPLPRREELLPEPVPTFSPLRLTTSSRSPTEQAREV